MTPWMGALTDNLEVLTHNQEGAWGRAATNDLLASRIKIRSMNCARAHVPEPLPDPRRSAEPHPKQMKTLITRAGPGTKIVCLGNVEQIDTPYPLAGDDIRPDLRGGPLQELGAQRAHHAAAWRALAPGGLRVGSAVSGRGRRRHGPSPPPLGLDRCRRAGLRGRHGQRHRLPGFRTPGGQPPDRHHQPARGALAQGDLRAIVRTCGAC